MLQNGLEDSVHYHAGAYRGVAGIRGVRLHEPDSVDDLCGVKWAGVSGGVLGFGTGSNHSEERMAGSGSDTVECVCWPVKRG